MSRDSIVITLVVVLAAGAIVAHHELRSPGTAQASAETYRKIALELSNQALYRESVAAYDRYLDLAAIDEAQQAAIHFQAGKLLDEKLKDYEAALARYIMAKNMAPQAAFSSDLNKRMVACLEQLGRSIDASAMLRESTKLKAERSNTPLPGAVIAEIGERKITMGDFEAQLAKLPPQYQSMFDTPEQKFEFFQQFVGREVLADAAARKGLNTDPELLRRVEDLKRDLMVQRLMEQESADAAKLSDADLELYHKAHADEFSTGRQVEVAHLLADDEATASQLLAELRGGASWDALVKKSSQDATSKDKAGYLGFVSAGQPVPGLGDLPSLVAAAQQTKPGSYSEVVESGLGHHILRVISEKPGETVPFAQVKEQVRQRMTAERSEGAQRQLLERYLKADGVKIHQNVFYQRLGATPAPAPAQP